MDKKKIGLIILSVFALLILIRGIVNFNKVGKGAKSVSLPKIEKKADSLSKPTNTPKFSKKRTAYKEWQGDPFVLDKIKPKVPEKDPSSAFVKRKSINLTGIVWDEDHPKAIINDEIVSIGDEVLGKKIINITKNKVSMDDGIRVSEVFIEMES